MSEYRQAQGHVVYPAMEPNSGWIKFGVSHESVYDRIRTLHQGRPLRDLHVPFVIYSKEPINLEIENFIHKVLEEEGWVRNGEWFHFPNKAKNIEAFFKNICNKYPNTQIVYMEPTMMLRDKRTPPHERHLPKTI